MPADRTFRRRGRIAGILLDDAQTYLVVDLIDTNERVYFYYGGRFDSGNLPGLPAGTHLVEAAAAAPPTAPSKAAARRHTEPARRPSSPPPSDGFGVGVVLVGIIALIYFRWNKTPVSETKTDTGRAIRLDRSPLSLRISVSTDGNVYGGPRPTSGNGDDFWKPADSAVRVDSYEVGGMVYLGAGLASAGGFGVEPALINPKLLVASDVEECSTRRLSYWPSYGESSPDARAAYLRWLSTGRKDPQADIGYVFLYFYGLERRALHDAKSSAAAKAELPAIEREVERLLGIYDNRSFHGYAGMFLDVLRISRTSDKLYLAAPPELRGRYLSFSHRLGLAQCAADEGPLPPEWAYIWLLGDPSTRLRTPAQRCPDEFNVLSSSN